MDRGIVSIEGLLGFESKENILSLCQKAERRAPYFNRKQLIELVK